mmetsp:Transcript_70930/g.125377  ORF Transcript_70930/g.125377 Transcript_70930/m.125377 type:complete len:418 (+) Transcript_70930:70-1323(+)|eukprot:CAMPEP_0197655984 /NCGR_PEP_ID=MMETSP1338-20131121/39795_1 /TAXON_ID=43686 ORGANISM="Pelagodinium beii, Strain RCC1491" /NCGR_SAMPLE_ID=MMETSP1338 /ASSEMBLY_ACC=CAM_ASM_000754 /LENGTH=417 /DNA_ID=CAMNT_0043231757 /DNA_START=62 /DNA_END=1315 /DNA_ORIENTATION=-
MAQDVRVLLALALLRVAGGESWCDMPAVENGAAIVLLQSGSSKRHATMPQPVPTAKAVKEYAFEDFTISLIQDVPAKITAKVPQDQEIIAGTPTNYIPLISLSLVVVGAVIPILVREGVRPFLVVIGYIASLSMVKAFVKQAMNQGFEYSNTITVMHMLASAGVAVICDRPQLKEALPALPIAVVVGLGIALNNAALLHTGVAFATMMGTCTPAVTFFVELITRRRTEIKAQTMVSLILVTSGSVMCVQGENSCSVIGFILICMALLCRSMKTIWQSDLLQVDMPPLHLVAWTSIWSAAYLIPVALVSEGTKPWTSLPTLSADVWQPLVASIISAAFLNICQCFAVKQLGSLLQNFIGNLNLILVIAIAATMMGEVVTRLQYSGILLMSFGVTLFKAKLDFAKNEAPEKTAIVNENK